MADLSNLLFLDTETTGMEKHDRLCQLAYIYRDIEYNELFKPPVPISVDAMAVCHITNKMVEDKPPFIGSPLFEQLATTLKNEGIIVAHNAMFDIDMLVKEGIVSPPFIDTRKVAVALDPKGVIPRYALQYLRYFLDLEIEGEAIAHDALGDVRVLKALFMRLLTKAMEDGRTEEDAIAWMVNVSSQPLLITRFNFGKYNGELVSDIAAKDAGYLEWLLNQKEADAASGKVDEDWIFTLKKYL